jgi:peptidyl-prolyl cis-trans isomerase D
MAFILGDLFTGGSSFFGNDQFVMSEVGGETIDYREFQSTLEDVIEVNKIFANGKTPSAAEMQNYRNQTWEQMVNEIIMSEEYENLGIDISEDELFDMVQGTNVDPVVKQFVTQVVGQYDPTFMIKFLKSMEDDQTGDSKKIWLFIEKDIVKRRLFNKYTNLVAKGLYIPTKMAEVTHKEENTTVDLEYVVDFYNNSIDSLIEVSDNELKEYYEKNKNYYKQEASRDITYVTFDVVPSEADNLAVKDWAESMVTELKTVDEIETFVNRESDFPFDTRHFNREDLIKQGYDSTLFDQELNYIEQPVFTNGSYRVVKVTDKVMIPDSVKAKHILVSFQKHAKPQAEFIADSIKQLIDAGEDFTQLALLHGEDGTAKEGGDLGWFGERQMVKPFEDAVFDGKVGDVVMIETSFGYHVIEITGKSDEVEKMQLAVLSRKVDPSGETYQMFYSEASRFAGENQTAEKFNSAVKEKNLIPRTVPNIRLMQDQIAGLDNPRQLIQWTFKSEEGAISEVFEFGNKYVIAQLTAKREKGVSTFEQMKGELTFEVRKEKKGKTLTEKMANATDLNQLATTVGGKINPAKGVGFMSFQLPGAGIEPSVLAYATSLEENKISVPIIGNMGVYVIKVLTKNQAPATEDYTAAKKSASQNLQSRATYEAYKVLKEAAEVEDFRNKFY